MVMDKERHRQEVEIVKAAKQGNRRKNCLPERYGAQDEADSI